LLSCLLLGRRFSRRDSFVKRWVQDRLRKSGIRVIQTQCDKEQNWFDYNFNKYYVEVDSLSPTPLNESYLLPGSPPPGNFSLK